MKCSTMKSCKVVAPLLAVLLLAGSASAIVGPYVVAPGSTTAHLTGVGGRNIDITIDYLVQTIGDYPSNQLPAVQTNGAYVYEYVLHNLGTSNVKVDLFSVAAELTASIDSIGTYGSSPAFNAFSSVTEKDPSGMNQSAKFVFAQFTVPGVGTFGDGSLGIGGDSYKLIFTSNFAPKLDGTALVSGGTIAGIAAVPTPVPEPISALLFGIGGLALARKRS